MIKAVLLIIRSANTWTHIAAAKRSELFILFVHLLPLLLVAGAVEGYGLVTWGKRDPLVREIRTFTLERAVNYELIQLAVSLAVVLVAARILAYVSETFRGRQTYNQMFTVITYGMAPIFLVRMLDAIPVLTPWISWAIGLFLCLGTLYSGVPIIMKPDPAHALGYYFMACVIVIVASGLGRFVTWMMLVGKFRHMDTLVLLNGLPGFCG